MSSYSDCYAGHPVRSCEPLKHLDIFVGEAGNPECEYPRIRQGGMHVHVDGLETYEQVKELIGYIHTLVNGSDSCSIGTGSYK